MAQSRPPFPTNAAALGYLRQMVSTYKGLKTYSGSVQVSGQITRYPFNPPIQANVVLQKPHLAAVSFTEDGASYRAVFDSRNLFITSSRHKDLYVKQPLSPNLGIMRTLTRVGMTGPGLTLLFSHADSLETTFSPASWASGAPTYVAGVPVVTVVSTIKQGANQLTLTYHIGQKDHLLRRMNLIQTTNGQTITLTEVHTRVKINAKVPIRTFTFTPPRGAKPTKAFPIPIL